MRTTRFIACVSAVLVSVGTLTVPSAAMAADTEQARIVLEPAPAESDARVERAAKPAVKQAPATSPKADHPPMSRARVITDLRAAAKCSAGAGRSWVVVKGPGDVRVAGWAQCSGGTWSLDVTTGSGHVGGMTLQSSDFVGTITIPRQGTATSNVRVRLPWAGSTLPKGTAAAALVLAPAGRELGGTVTVIDSAKAGRITMSGTVLANGTFVLKANGDVLFAGKSVPMSGVYRSGANRTRGGGAQPTWNFSGVGTDVKVPGASFDRPRLTMSHASPGIQGSGQVTIAQYDLRSPVRIAVLDGTSWNASLLGAQGGVRKDPRLPGLVLRADGATGSISSVRGRIQWNVRMPMSLVDGAIIMRGNATLIGPDKLRLAPTSGIGDIYGTGRPAAFTVSAGSLVLEGRKTTGRLAMGAIGEQLVDLPSGWTSVSVLEMTPRFGSGPTATFERSLKYVMTDRTSRVSLSGKLPATGPFTLTASGHLGIGATKVPVQGRYIGAGPRQSANPGRLLISANTDRTPKRYADLRSGARAERTTFFLSTEGTTPPISRASTPRAISLPTVKVTSKSNTSTTGGTVTLTVSDINTSGTDDSVTFTANWTYANGKYTVTLKGSGTAYWEPYEGLKIPYSSISGTIIADDSTDVNSWNINVSPAVTWNVGDGITLTSSFTFSSTCTQDMAKTCPSPAVPGTFFVSGSSSILNIPVTSDVTIPQLSAYGAFRSDGLWARWDAEVKPGEAVEVSYLDASVSLTDAQLALFSSAQREDTSALPANLVMPDLSALSKAKMNLQVCGSFKVEVFEISTGNVPGCLALTPKGKVLAQTNTGGSSAGGAVNNIDDHNGLELDKSDPPKVNGYAYSDIDPKSTPDKKPASVKLYNQVLSLVPKTENLTVDIPVPGSLMESFGTGISQTTDLIATGWFSKKTNEMYIDLDIPVNLKASGVTVQDINMSIYRKKEASVPSYDFILDASGEAAIQGNHYPFDAQVELKEGTANYAAVSLAVIGEFNSQSIGLFDDTSYLPEGDFEPASASLIDGGFDDNLAPNDFADGGFEAGTPANNIVPNSSFEDSASFNLLPKDQATFNGDRSGNLMYNADYEETDVMYNGDFEGVEGVDTSASDGPLGWSYITASGIKFDYSENDPGPSGNGTTVFCVQNTSSTSETYATGLQQMTRPGVVNGGTYKLTGYVRGNSSATNQRVLVSFADEKGNLSASKAVTITQSSGWNSFELTGTATGSFKNAVVSVYLTAGKSSGLCFDDITFERTSGDLNEIVGSPKGPDFVESFDSSVDSWGVNYSGIGSRQLGGQNNALKTDGCSSYWAFIDGTRGYVMDGKVPWDMSLNVYINASKEEDVNVGFLMSGYGSNIDGFFLKLKNAADTKYGGFWSVKDGKTGQFGGGMSNLASYTWHNVRIIGWGGNRVTGVVTNLATGAVIFSKTTTLPDVGWDEGVFGQYPGNKCEKDGDSEIGSFWDNFQLRTPSVATGVMQDASGAHSGNRYAQVKAGASGSTTYTAVGEPIYSGHTYTYSAWVKAKSGTVTGNVAIKGISNVWDNTQETIATKNFSIGTSWTQVRMTWAADRDYSDVAVGFSNLSNQGVFYVDDQSFQEVPYGQYAPSGQSQPLIDVVPDPKDSTDNVMSYVPTSSNSAALYWVDYPFATTKYHLSATVRTIAGDSQPITLHIYDGDGKSSASQAFTVGKDDTTIGPVSLTSAGGNGKLRIAFETQNASSGFYIDDVTLTATETTSDQKTGGNSYGTLGKLPAPTDWSVLGTAPVLVNSPGMATSGEAYLRLPYGSSVYRGFKDVTAPVPGQTYSGSLWVRAAGSSPVKVSAQLNTRANGVLLQAGTAREVALTPGAPAVEVPFSLVVTTAGATEMGLYVVNEMATTGNPSSPWIAIDDITIQRQGLSIVDPFTLTGNMGLVSVDDSVNAHESENYLALTSSGAASVQRTATVKPTTTARTFSAWVRSPSSTPVSGSISLGVSGGTTATANFTADSTWRQVMVTLNGLTAGTSQNFTSRISLNGSSTLWVDDLVTRDLAPFTPTASGMTVGVVSAPTDTSSPPNYLLFSGGGGKGISAPTTVSSPILGGATYSVRAHVKAASGTKVSGTIGLDFGSTAGTAISPQLEQGDSVNFTADDTWQQIAATFQVPGGSFTNITPKFILGGSGGTVHIDTISVTPVQIALDQVWTPSGSAVTWGVWDDPSNAHDGSLGVLKMRTSSTAGTGMSTTFPKSSANGDVYAATVWARTDSGATADFTAELRATGGADEAASKSVTLNGDWQFINIRLPITQNHSNMKLSLTTKTANVQIYVDDAAVVSNRWSANDTSTRTNLVANPSLEKDISGWAQQNGSTLTRTSYQSWTGSYGGEIEAADPTRQGYLVYGLPGMKPQTQYTISAYVWLPEGAAPSDLPDRYDLFWFVDYGNSAQGVASNIKTVQPDYSKTMEWQRVSITATSTASPNMSVRFMAPYGGGWYIDGLVVEEAPAASAYFEGTQATTSLNVVSDGPGSYEGSGYAQLTTLSASGATMTANAAGNVSGAQNYTVYVRSATGEPVSGSIGLTNACTASQPFTVKDEWLKVDTTCSASSGKPLTMGVTVTTPGGVLDVDSVRLSNTPEDPITHGNVMGVSTPLDHPETGYRYLWDDAFGIAGMHLWGFTVQIDVNELGEPGLGMQATVYQDPTKTSGLLYGTDWLKGDALIDIDEVTPCFDFGFTSVSTDGQPLGNSGLSIANGALKAEDFHMTFAPRGCAVGPYKVKPGAAVLFDALVGDGTLHFDLDYSVNPKGQPQFSGDLHVTDLDIGGIDYRNLEMAVLVSPTDDSVTYQADMQLPMGGFKGDFSMVGSTVGADQGVHVDGSAELTDWGWTSSSNKGLKINEFDFDVKMDVGPTNCGTLKVDAVGDASADFAVATALDFDGSFEVDCGILEEFQIRFDYTHGGITEDFYLKYDAATLTLAGGVDFQLQRKTSWKYLGYRYHRTARIDVYMDFTMDIADPSSSEAQLGADVKVANGSGSAECKITGQPSDSCSISLSVSTTYFGTHKWSESW